MTIEQILIDQEALNDLIIIWFIMSIIGTLAGMGILISFIKISDMVFMKISDMRTGEIARRETEEYKDLSAEQIEERIHEERLKRNGLL